MTIELYERKNITLGIGATDIKATGEGGYSFEGYASKFGGVDSYRDTILPGAYKKVLSEMKKQSRAPKMFFNHGSYSIPMGKWDKLAEDDSGLYVHGTLTKGMSQAEDIRLALAAGTLDGMSVGIGLKREDVEYAEADGDIEYTRIIKNISALPEISLVTFPADDKGRVDMSTIKSELMMVASLADLEQFLRDAGGFSKSAATAVVSRAKSICLGEQGEDIDTKIANEANAILRGAGLIK